MIKRFFVLFSLLFLSLFPSTLIAEEPNVTELNIKVLSVIRKAEMKYTEDPNNKWIALTEGSVVHRGATIQTGFKSGLLLGVGKSKVYIGSTTRITIEQALQNKDFDSDISIFLVKGKTYNTVNPEVKGRRVDFRVTTPVAVASVRGTEFVVWAKGYVKVLKGTVNLSASDHKSAKILSDEDFGKRPEPPKDGEGGKDIHAGNGGYVDRNGNVPEPKPFDNGASGLDFENGVPPDPNDPNNPAPQGQEDGIDPSVKDMERAFSDKGIGPEPKNGGAGQPGNPPFERDHGRDNPKPTGNDRQYATVPNVTDGKKDAPAVPPPSNNKRK